MNITRSLLRCVLVIIKIRRAFYKNRRIHKAKRIPKERPYNSSLADQLTQRTCWSKSEKDKNNFEMWAKFRLEICPSTGTIHQLTEKFSVRTALWHKLPCKLSNRQININLDETIFSSTQTRKPYSWSAKENCQASCVAGKR